jgi:hypothetical protein
MLTHKGFLVAAFGLFGGYLYLIYQFSISPGFRVHQWNLQLKAFPDILKVGATKHAIVFADLSKGEHIRSLLYGLTVMLLKVAILLSWVRTFVPMDQRNAMFWTSRILIWCNILFYGIGTTVEIGQCSPREKMWNPLYIGGNCINIDIYMKASGVVNLVSDLVILVLPQAIIWKLRISRGRKVGISLLFAIGLMFVAPLR